MLSGYEETEREILATLKFDSNFLSNYNNQKENYMVHSNSANSIQNYKNQISQRDISSSTSFYSTRFRIFKAKSRFRTGVICVIAISRIKYFKCK